MTPLLGGVRVLVTGTSRGIGQAATAAMATQGAEVVALARTAQEWSEVVPREVATRIHPMDVDVSDPEAVHDACERARGLLGTIDVLVNNAGVPGPEGPAWEVDPRDAQLCLAVNTLGPFHLMHEVLPSMVSQGRGVVINVSSGAAERPKAGKAWYGASKAALDHLVLAAVLELAGTGVRIHGIHPGPVDTALNHSNRRGDGDRSRLRPPSEVASLITWLSSREAAEVVEPLVRWREAEVKARFRAMPGFPAPVEVD